MDLLLSLIDADHRPLALLLRLLLLGLQALLSLTSSDGPPASREESGPMGFEMLVLAHPPSCNDDIAGHERYPRLNSGCQKVGVWRGERRPTMNKNANSEGA